MSYFIIPYIPDGLITRKLKQRMRKEGWNYKIGNLGVLMDENYEEAIRNNSLRYNSKDLKKLKGVSQNSNVVEVAYEILEEELNKKGLELPQKSLNKKPYYTDQSKLAKELVLNAVLMTILISFSVVLVPNIVAMTTLIVLISIVGAIKAIHSIYTCVIFVD